MQTQCMRGRLIKQNMNHMIFLTPAQHIVQLHPPLLADVHRDHFTPEQQALHQHPAERRQEKQMQERRHQPTDFLLHNNKHTFISTTSDMFTRMQKYHSNKNTVYC